MQNDSASNILRDMQTSGRASGSYVISDAEMIQWSDARSHGLTTSNVGGPSVDSASRRRHRLGWPARALPPARRGTVDRSMSSIRRPTNTEHVARIGNIPAADNPQIRQRVCWYGAAVRASDFRSSGRGFNSRWWRNQVTYRSTQFIPPG